jgi:endonuclease-3 related protein
MNKKKRYLKEIFVKLFGFFGPQHWWPADGPFEVAIGAILTQNTNWQNVEKAISNLKNQGILNAEAIHSTPLQTLARFIKPAGYYNVKARRLKAFVQFLIEEFRGKIEEMASEDIPSLRKKLLQVYGIGPETADSILLYALNKPVFVVDAYTKRILSRHGLINKKASYEEIQSLFHQAMEPDPFIYNEYHALIVKLGKTFCRPRPLCRECPLRIAR